MKQQKPKKPKKCKGCEMEFIPKQNLQSYCSAKCAPRKERKPIKSKVLSPQKSNEYITSNDLTNLLRIVFNAFIRERDKGKTCISCSIVLTENYDAGHYYPVSTHGHLRFNEDNVHGQCKDCNQFKDGNTDAYFSGLVRRIGAAGVERLELSNKTATKAYLDKTRLIIEYKQRIEKLKTKK